MKPRGLPLGLVILLVAATGCGRGENAEDRQINAMRDEIDNVAASQDRENSPVETAETKGAGAGPKGGPAGQDPAAAGKNRAPNVNPGGPPDDEEMPAEGANEGPQPTSDDPEDATPRPTIRVNGGGGGVPTRPPPPVLPRRGGGVPRGQDLIHESMPDEPTLGSSPGTMVPGQGPARSSALDPEAKRAYEAALALVQSGRYAQALDQFAAFLVKWPDHPYAENATYWRGEAYFAQGDYARAIEQFEGVLARFQTGNKVPDALLKLGLSYQKLGNPQKARGYFDRLAREFPKSDAARRIPHMENQ